MQGKLFQRCTHLVYCSVLSLGGNVNKWWMSHPDMGSIFHIKKSIKYSGHRKLLCELSKLNAFILHGYLTNTDASILLYKFRPERTDSLYTQSICNCNKLSLHYNREVDSVVLSTSYSVQCSTTITNCAQYISVLCILYINLIVYTIL